MIPLNEISTALKSNVLDNIFAGFNQKRIT